MAKGAMSVKNKAKASTTPVKRVLPDLITPPVAPVTVPVTPIADAAVAATGAFQNIHNIADKSGNDAVLMTELIAIMRAPKTVKRGPGFIYNRWLVNGTDLAAFPIVGKQYKEGTNEPYDVRKIPYMKDGERKYRRISWVEDFTDDMLKALPEMEQPDWHIRQCELALATPPSGYYMNRAGDEEELAAIKTDWSDQRKNAISAVKKGIRLHHQIARVNTMKFCTVELVRKRGDNGELELSETTKPVIVFDRHNPTGDRKRLSVASFLSLKPPGSMEIDTETGVETPHPKTVPVDATVAKLLASSSKGKEDDDGDGSEQNPDDDAGLIKTVPEFSAEIGRVLNYLDTEAYAVMLHKTMRLDTEAGRDMRKRVVEFAAMINVVADTHRGQYLADLKAENDRILAQQAAAANARIAS